LEVVCYFVISKLGSHFYLLVFPTRRYKSNQPGLYKIKAIVKIFYFIWVYLIKLTATCLMIVYPQSFWIITKKS
ncbi:hypothetical protein CWN55_19185, partial [Klebsiella pneumoniae]